MGPNEINALLNRRGIYKDAKLEEKHQHEAEKAYKKLDEEKEKKKEKAAKEEKKDL